MIENIRLAFAGIWGHKLRSLLTMLGIIIGIAAIIAIVSTIQGTNEQIKQNLIGAGNNTVNVQLNQGDYPYDPGWGEPLTGVPVVSKETIAEIENLNEVNKASAYNFRTWADGIYYQKNPFNGQIYGVDENYFQVTNYRPTAGTFFTPQEYRDFSKVVVIDSTAANSLFPTEDPIGKRIDISNEPFTIVGVAQVQSEFKPTINSLNDYFMYNEPSSGSIFIPISSWSIVYKFDEPQNVILQAVETDAMPKAGKDAADILNSTLSEPDETISYKSENLLEQAQRLQELANATNQQLVWIASISLLVGGIGVMNIMLVSVTERTKEIGLKKAVGARKSHVMSQFLTEAAVLTFVGGVIGVVGGIALSALISQFSGAPTSISIPVILIAVIFSMLIGIIFGLLPAFKAANLSPIDALRRE